MKRKAICKAIIAIAVAMAFVMPVAAFANVGTIGVTSDSEITGDIENIVEISTNSDNTETNSDDSYDLDTEDTIVAEETIDIAMPTTGNTIYVDDDRPPEWYNETQVKTIAEGIINATAGDTVYVYNGTYYEHVTVTKQLDLVGESKENVIIDGSGDGNVVYITAGGMSIDTFTLTNGSYGIYLDKSPNSNIINCDAYNNEYGIYNYNSADSEIINCDVYNNEEYGIYFVFAFNNNITNCDVYNNDNYGLCLYQSTSKLRDNTIHGNFYDFNIVGYDISHFYQDINPSNTVNGKPIYYLTGQENMTLDETYNIGYLGLISCTNITVKNSDVYGVVIADTTDSTISNVNSHNSEIGISLWGSSNTNNIIINCNIYNNNYGISSWSASNNDITNCNLYNNNYGIYLFLSSNYKLRGNTLYDNAYNFGVEGPEVIHFYHDIDTSNAINGKPIRYLVGQSDLTIDNFGFLGLIDCTNITAENSDVTGILIVDTTDSTISNVNSHNSGIGIYLWKAFNNDITNCDAYSNNDGIYFYYSSYNNITNCDAYDNSRHGIYMEVASNNNNIIDCDAYNNENGIWLYNANNNIIENSKVYDNSQGGFYLRYSANCTLSDNIIYNNVYNFDVEGWDLSTFYHDIAPANTVNGKSIYYLVEQKNLTFDETDNIGYLGMISCTNITVKNADVGGVLIVNTTDSTISNVNSHTSGNGIYFWGASNNDIIGCDAYNNEYGIHLRESSYNNIENCNVYDNKWGIYLNQASNNDIINCNVYDNLYDGIHLFYSTSTNNDIINCNVYGNGLTDDNVMNKNGIAIMQASNNNIIGCNIYDNSQHGIEIFMMVNYNNVENCTIYNNSEYGIYLYIASNSNIENCEIYNNQYGIYAYLMSSYNNIINCEIYNNDKGIYIDYMSGNNNILNCDLYDNNEISILIDFMSNFNVIHHNNFINNHQNAKDTGFNTWDDGSEGNYWDDYTGVDEDGNGIGDTPYSIPGGYNNDKYPLMVPIDDIPPAITNVQATPEVQNTTAPVNITCTVTDNWDLVDTVTIFITEPYGFILEATMNDGYWYEDTYATMGVYYYYIVANDTSGNIATSDTYSFVVTDLTTPISAVQPLPQWTKTVPFTVTATAYDNTGVASVTLYSRYSEDGTEWTEWTSYGIDDEEPWSWEFTGSDGYYEFYSIAVDDFDNVEEAPDPLVADASTGLDTTDPVTTIILDGTMGDNGWYVSDVMVTLSATDDLSGVESTWYRLDSGNWKLYTAPFTVSSEGQHTVEPYSLDRAGNSEDTKSADFKIDKTLPMTEHEFDGIIGEDGWFVSDVTVTLSATDVMSGVNYTMYKLNDGTWIIYTEPFVVTEDGEHTLYYYSVDLAGNVEVINEAEFKIDHDTEPPVTTHQFDGIIGDNDWFVSDVTVTLSAIDFSPSGINHTYYKLDDDTEWTEYTGSFYVTEDDEHTLMYYSVDYLENEEEPKGPFAFKIDKTVPTIELTWDKEDSKLVADVDDETSGVAKVEFYLNGELLGEVTAAPYEWEVTKPKKGDKGQAIVFDNAGNNAVSPEINAVSQSQSQSSSSTSVPWPFSWLLNLW